MAYNVGRFNIPFSLDGKLILILAVLLATPFYFVQTSNGLTFAPILAFDQIRTKTGFGLPLALIAIAPLFALALFRLFKGQLITLDWVFILPFSFMIWCTLVFLVGIWASESPFFSALLFTRTMLPIGIFLAARHLPLTSSCVEKTFVAIPVVGSVTITILFLSLALLSKDHTLPIAYSRLQEAFTGAKNLQAMVVALGLVIILASLSTNQKLFNPLLLWVSYSAHLMYLLIIWSRSGLFVIATIYFIWIAIEIKRGFWKQFSSSDWIKLSFVVALTAILGVSSVTFAGVTLVRPNSVINLIPKSVNELVGKETKSQFGTSQPDFQKQGDSRRIALLKEGIRRSLERPFLGDKFQPLPTGTSASGLVAPGYKSFPSHNQYVDLAILAGIPAVVIYLMFLASVFWNLRKNFSQSFLGQVAVMSAAALVVITLSGLFQNYLFITQTGGLFFLILGLASRRWAST